MAGMVTLRIVPVGTPADPDAHRHEHAALLDEYHDAHGDEMATGYGEQVITGATGRRGLQSFVAHYHHKAVGCVSILHRGELAELRYLWVRPEARRLGAGRALVAHAIDTARRSGATRVALTTSATMQPAQLLYERLGFTRTDNSPCNACREPISYELTL